MEPTAPETRTKSLPILLAFILILLFAGIIVGIVALARTDANTTRQVRDIFIIILALESLLIGAALIILVVQLAVLTNLLQNEVRPILESTKETVGTLRSTSQFISKRAVTPIISISSFLAGIRKFFELIGFIRQN